MSMRRKLILACVLASVPAWADWPRFMNHEGDFRNDNPPARPLAAFTEFPWRDRYGYVCFPCSADQIEWSKSEKARTELKLVGTVNGTRIYDLFYFSQYQEEPAMKSILIQTGKDSYREIYHNEP